MKAKIKYEQQTREMKKKKTQTISLACSVIILRRRNIMKAEGKMRRERIFLVLKERESKGGLERAFLALQYMRSQKVMSSTNIRTSLKLKQSIIFSSIRQRDNNPWQQTTLQIHNLISTSPPENPLWLQTCILQQFQSLTS